jgi:hypothetical protein
MIACRESGDGRVCGGYGCWLERFDLSGFFKTVFLMRGLEERWEAARGDGYAEAVAGIVYLATNSAICKRKLVPYM